jgi:hypothetical protein
MWRLSLSACKILQGLIVTSFWSGYPYVQDLPYNGDSDQEPILHPLG